jgi:predicted RNase H-like HicB family nuclease
MRGGIASEPGVGSSVIVIYTLNRMIMKQLTYRVLLNREPDGGYTVTVPTLPGCITYGETIDEAITMAKEAIELYIESLVVHNEPIPDESNMLEYSLTLEAAVSAEATRLGYTLFHVNVPSSLFIIMIFQRVRYMLFLNRLALKRMNFRISHFKQTSSFISTTAPCL